MKPKQKKWTKRAIMFIGMIVFILLIAFFFSQTVWFKNKISEYAQKTLSELTGYSVFVGEISGILPFNINISKLSFNDDKGEWLKISNLSIRLSVSKLLSRTFYFKYVLADNISFERIPEIVYEDGKKNDLEDWRRFIPKTLINAIRVKELSLGGDILGKKTVFALRGRLDAMKPIKMINGMVCIRRIYTDEAYADLYFSIEGSNPVIGIELQFYEEKDGILAGLLNLKNAENIIIKIKGKGPLDAWEATASGEIKNYGDFDIKFIIAKQDGEYDLRKPNPSISGKIKTNVILDNQKITSSGQFDWSNGKISLLNIFIETEYGVIEGDFSLATDKLFGEEHNGKIEGRMSITSKANLITKRLLPENYFVEGDIFSQLNLAGFINKPEISGKLKVENCSINDVKTKINLQNINIETLIGFQNGALSIKDFQAKKGDNFVTAELDFKIGEPIWKTDLKGDFHGVLTADFDIADIGGFFLTETNKTGGKITTDIEASGTFSEPEVNGIINAKNVNFLHNDLEIVKDLGSIIEFHFLNNNLKISRFVFEEKGTMLRGDFSFHIDPSEKAILKEEAIQGKIKVGADLKYISGFLNPTDAISGTCDAEIEISGNIKNPELKGALQINNANYKTEGDKIRIEDLSANLSLSLKNGIFYANCFNVLLNGARVEGNFLFTGFQDLFQPDYNANVKGILRAETQISKIAGILSLDDLNPEGRLFFETTIGGSLSNPSFKGTMNIVEGIIIEPAAEKPVEKLSADVEFFIQDGTLDIKTFRLAGMDSSIDGNIMFQGSGNIFNLNTESGIEGNISAIIDLAPLSKIILSGDNNFDGNILMKLNISGKVFAPVFKGDGILANGYYENTATGTIIKDITATIKADGSEIILSEISANDGERGIIKGTGKLDFGSLKTKLFETYTSLENTVFLRIPEFSGVFNGKLNAYGSFEKTTIVGNLSATRLEIKLPERFSSKRVYLEILQDIVVEKGERESEITGKTDSKSNLFKAALDIAISVPARAFVRGHGLDSEWQGEIFIKGDTENPLITGKLSIVRGSIDFAGRRFNLSKGLILFDRLDTLVPSIDIRAETSTNGITAIIRLYGALTAPLIEISSTPSLPQNEIISQVLFSKRSSEITALQALQLRRTISSLSGGHDAFDFLEQTRVIMGLDRLELEQTSADDASLSAGKYIGGDIYFKVNKKLGGSGGGISAEKQLTPRISVESGIDADGSSGFQIKWKWDY